MSIATEEQTSSTASRSSSTSAASGATLRRRNARGDRPVHRGAAREVADATPEDAMAALDAAVETQAEWAATPPNDRAGILWKAFELLTERADELATLMTLEMGKPVAESKAEIVYAADFFRWFSGEALRIDGNYKQFANGTSRVLVMKQPVGPRADDHALELPDGDGHAQGRPGDRRRLHDRGQAGAADAAVDAGAGARSSRRRAARRRRQHPHDLVVGHHDGAADRGPAPAQALLHGLDRGRAQADRGLGQEGAQDVDGARRQRALPDLRRRRPRRRGRGRAARQDAQHRRGLHVGQPLPRGRAGARGVRSGGWPRRWARSSSGAAPRRT